MQHQQKKVIVVAGPTAVGKTAVAIQLAQQLGTEIISADSRQCYRELNIGVARPAPEELAAVPHHFIASHSIHQKVTAATFEAYALDKAAALFQQKETVVMVGGTGLYIKAFCEGLDAIPDVPEELRAELLEAYNQHGLAWLQQQVALADPPFFAVAEKANPHRLLRALEVYRATGKSILHFRKGAKANRPFRIVKIGLALPKEELHRRIHLRVDQMIAADLVDEAKALLPHRHLPPLQTVGYRELFPFFDGKQSLPAAIEEIKKATRHYAKRQITWFKKDPQFTWLHPHDFESLQQAMQH